jgi:hypothetical protein
VRKLLNTIVISNYTLGDILGVVYAGVVSYVTIVLYLGCCQ